MTIYRRIVAQIVDGAQWNYTQPLEPTGSGQAQPLAAPGRALFMDEMIGAATDQTGPTAKAYLSVQ